MSYEFPKPFEWNFCGACGGKLSHAHDGQSEKPYCAPCNRFFYRNPVPAACCFVRRGKDELLFAQRAVQPCRGEWSLPGGFVELGETTEEAALRELREETGLRAERARLFGVSTRQSPVSGAVMVLGYIVDEWEGEEQMAPDSDAMSLKFCARAERPPLAFHVHRELLALYDAQLENG
ncbi:MAG: NUDIX hydrolase [Candidatus Hydrogenedentes bacterium]|nr:NUDIX hydrolase [Candidatus Hydrogenedentota bacterium]